MERANPDIGRWLKGLAQRSGLRAFWRWWLAGACAADAGGHAHGAATPAAASDRRHRARRLGALGTSRRERRARVRRRRANSAAGRSRGSRARRARGDRRVAARQRRHDPLDARRDRPSREPGAAQVDRASRGRRGESASDARVRPRPAHAVQGRRSVFRRDRRGTRRGTQGDPRRAGGGAEELRRSGATARRIVGRPGRCRHARTPFGCRGARGDHAELAAAGRAARDVAMAPVADVGAARGHRDRRIGRHRVADLAEARLRDFAQPTRRPGESAGRRIERAARRARAAHRRLQLCVAAQIRVPGCAAGGRGRHQAAARRHVAHAARDEDDGARQGRAPRNRAARRKRERGTPRFPARGVERVRASRAALADDEDPAGPRRDLRPRRPVEDVAVAADPCARRDRAAPRRRAATRGDARRRRLAPACRQGGRTRTRREGERAGERQARQPSPRPQRKRTHRRPPRRPRSRRRRLPQNRAATAPGNAARAAPAPNGDAEPPEPATPATETQ